MTNFFFFLSACLKKKSKLCPSVARQAWELEEGEGFWKGSSRHITKLVKGSVCWWVRRLQGTGPSLWAACP